MGGKGGLNILPQKKWNVYNWDNRIKVMENEKIVNSELEKIDRKKKDKSLSDKVKILKNVNHDEIDYDKYNFSHEVHYDKNKIFKEIMERQSMGKKLKVEMLFEKMKNPTKIENVEELKFFEAVDHKSENKEVAEPVVEHVTFKDSIKNNLNPWYSKLKKEDYKFYKNPKSDDKFLGKKHKEEKNYHSDNNNYSCSNIKTQNKNSDKKKRTIEELREERITRERKEKEKINKFLNRDENK